MPRTTHGACSQTPGYGCAAEMHGEVTCSGCHCVCRDFLRKTDHEPLLAMTRPTTKGVHTWTLSLPESEARTSHPIGKFLSRSSLSTGAEEKSGGGQAGSMLKIKPLPSGLALAILLFTSVFPAVSVLILAQSLWSPLSSYKTTAIATSTWRPG